MRKDAAQREADAQDSTGNVGIHAQENASAAELGILAGDNLKKFSQRARARNGSAPPNPASLAALASPEKFRMYQRGPREQEVSPPRVAGAEQGGGRFLIFGNNANSGHPEASHDWFAYGASRASPPPSAQVFTTHSARPGQISPAAYALLPKKQGAKRNLLFQVLKQLRHGLKPTWIMTHFESEAVGLPQYAVPNSSHVVCFLYLCQSIYGEIQQFGPATTYAENGDFALKTRNLSASAPAPPEDVVAHFEEISLPLLGLLPDELRPVGDY